MLRTAGAPSSTSCQPSVADASDAGDRESAVKWSSASRAPSAVHEPVAAAPDEVAIGVPVGVVPGGKGKVIDTSVRSSTTQALGASSGYPAATMPGRTRFTSTSCATVARSSCTVASVTMVSPGLIADVTSTDTGICTASVDPVI